MSTLILTLDLIQERKGRARGVGGGDGGGRGWHKQTNQHSGSKVRFKGPLMFYHKTLFYGLERWQTECCSVRQRHRQQRHDIRSSGSRRTRTAVDVTRYLIGWQHVRRVRPTLTQKSEQGEMNYVMFYTSQLVPEPTL